MTKHIFKYISLGIIFTLIFSVNAYGQAEKQDWSKKTSRVVAKAMKQSNSGEHEKALQKYEKLLKNAELNAYETSSIYQLKAQNE